MAVSKGLGQGLPSGAAWPRSEAAVMWSHMTVARQAAVRRTVEQVELLGRQALYARANDSDRSEAPGPGGRGAGAGLRRLTESVLSFQL